MQKIVYVFGFVLAIGLWSCEKDKDPIDTDWKEGVIHFEGEPELDGCGWLLLWEGESYYLPQLSEEFKIDGTDVWFKGEKGSEVYLCGLGAVPYSHMLVEEMMLKPWVARELDDYPDYELALDGFAIDSVRIDGDVLHMHVGYSGGCAHHQFNLWILENGDDGDPHLLLEHNGNGDMCEAYPWEWLAFDIKNLQEKGKGKVKFWLRGSPTMSMVYGPYVYEY